MSHRVEVIRASDAFLYLPLYLAESHQLFEEVQQDKKWCRDFGLPEDMHFDFSRSTLTGKRPGFPGKEGDANALRELSKLVTRDVMAFAICDPLAIFEAGVDEKEFVVVGALIKQSPFWLVSSDDSAGDIADMKELSKLIIYSDELASGYCLGKRVAEKYGVPNGTAELEKVDAVGKEIALLVACKRAGDTHACAISVDLLGMARAMHLEDTSVCKPIAPLKKIIGVENFVTTGIVTSRKILANKKGLAATMVMLQGLKRAVVMTRISPGATALLCKQEAAHEAFKPQLRLKANDPEPPPLTLEESNWLGRHILRDDLYSIDMSISKAEWKGAANVGRWDANGTRARRAVALYDDIVKNRPEQRMTLAAVDAIAPDFVKRGRAVEYTILAIMLFLALALSPFYAQYLSSGCKGATVPPWPQCIFSAQPTREIEFSASFFAPAMVVAIWYMTFFGHTRRWYRVLVHSNPSVSLIVSIALCVASGWLTVKTKDAVQILVGGFFATFLTIAWDCLKQIRDSDSSKK